MLIFLTKFLFRGLLHVNSFNGAHARGSNTGVQSLQVWIIKSAPKGLLFPFEFRDFLFWRLSEASNGQTSKENLTKTKSWNFVLQKKVRPIQNIHGFQLKYLECVCVCVFMKERERVCVFVCEWGNEWKVFEKPIDGEMH